MTTSSTPFSRVTVTCMFNGADLESSFNIDQAYLKNAFLREPNLENQNIIQVDKAVLNKTNSPIFAS